MQPARIPDAFPAPEHRGNQADALERIRDAFAAGNRVVLVRAPTGSGKSLLARAIMGAARRPDEADPADAVGAYYTTPQVSQLDDVAADPLLDDLNVIRGKTNYSCILPGERQTPVDRAPCVRETGFDCRVRNRCPYFSDRAIASNREIAAMTLAYFMQTAGSDVFRPRDVVVIDEAHGLAEWAEMYATIELAPRTVPGWPDLKIPALDDDPDAAVDFAEHLAARLGRRKDDLLAQSELDPDEAAQRDRLQERIGELEWFVEDYRSPHSATTWLVDQPDGAGAPVTIKPMAPERYLQHTVWDRGNRFALLSATILNRDAFCRQVGLNPADVALVDVGHTFPLAHRPLYDVTCGKMTYDHRDETVPELARTIVRVMAAHPEETGIVHCHAYSIQDRLLEHLRDFGVAGRVRAHDRDDRDAQLETWLATDDPEVFLSVKMEEALDLEGDLAHWQVVCKAPYPNTSDSRVERRLEEGRWAWYHRTALRTVIQACGRVVRSPDDHGATYLADASLLDLFDRARADMPDWFANQVDATTAPDLPAFDPAAALAGVDATAGRTGGNSGRAGADGDTSGGRDGGASGGAGGGRRGRSSGAGRSGGGRSGDRDRSSPLADAWDVD